MRNFIKFGLIRVNGESMAPALPAGKILLVKFISAKQVKKALPQLKINQIVVITAPNYPDLWQIKRVKRINLEKNEIWVEGDNPQSTDSRIWGYLDSKNLVGKVVWPNK